MGKRVEQEHRMGRKREKTEPEGRKTIQEARNATV